VIGKNPSGCGSNDMLKMGGRRRQDGIWAKRIVGRLRAKRRRGRIGPGHLCSLYGGCTLERTSGYRTVMYFSAVFVARSREEGRITPSTVPPRAQLLTCSQSWP
jgi:hypothetical protein